MKPFLDKHGELLPLECPDAELWVFNPTIVLNALDENASEGPRFRDGRFMNVDKHVFYADVVASVDMFKLANWRASPTFVSDRFVDLWNASRLRGLEFEKLWSSEELAAHDIIDGYVLRGSSTSMHTAMRISLRPRHLSPFDFLVPYEYHRSDL